MSPANSIGRNPFDYVLLPLVICRSDAVEVDEVYPAGASPGFAGFEVEEHVGVTTEFARAGVAADCGGEVCYGVLVGSVSVVILPGLDCLWWEDLTCSSAFAELNVW